MPVNIEKYKELLILIMGPLFQVLAYYILLLVLPNYKETITFYHFNILFFNLLPIYPLDGGKILNILISEFIPFKKSLIISIIISYITSIFLFIKLDKKLLNIIIMELLLIILITKEYRKINYIYNKFLLERYLNSYKFKKINIIKNEENMYRDHRHLLKKEGKYYTENEFLTKKYKK